MAAIVSLSSSSALHLPSASSLKCVAHNDCLTARIRFKHPLQLPNGISKSQPHDALFTAKNGSHCTKLSDARPLTMVHSLASEGATQVSSGESGNVREIFSSEEFKQCIEEAGDKLVVLDIATKTCGPCKMIYPKFVALSLEYPDAVFLKINGDHSENTRALMREWGVRAVPNFRFFRNGELIHKHNGAKEEELRKNFLAYYP